MHTCIYYIHICNSRYARNESPSIYSISIFFQTDMIDFLKAKLCIFERTAPVENSTKYYKLNFIIVIKYIFLLVNNTIFDHFFLYNGTVTYN